MCFDTSKKKFERMIWRVIAVDKIRNAFQATTGLGALTDADLLCGKDWKGLVAKDEARAKAFIGIVNNPNFNQTIALQGIINSSTRNEGVYDDKGPWNTGSDHPDGCRCAICS